jgi:carbonic anhydrase
VSATTQPSELAAPTITTTFPPDKFTLALAQNRAWASREASESPELLAALAAGQSPEILWIGCSDSRVPETTICGLKPGDIFVHRNIANILHPGDINSACVIEFAVVHLKVKHVVLCGHTSCGGVAAALGNKSVGIIDAWLLPLRTLRMRFHDLLEPMGREERLGRLVEENVREGVRTLKAMSNIIEATKTRGLQVHGLVYNVGTGELQLLDTEEDATVAKTREECFTVAA